MVNEEYNMVDSSKLPLGILISIISRGQTFFLNHSLNEFGINYSQLHVLYEIAHQNKVNQETVDYKEAPHKILNPTKCKNAIIADVSSNDAVSDYGSVFTGNIDGDEEGMNVGTYQPLIKMVSFFITPE